MKRKTLNALLFLFTLNLVACSGPDLDRSKAGLKSGQASDFDLPGEAMTSLELAPCVIRFQNLDKAIFLSRLDALNDSVFVRSLKVNGANPWKVARNWLEAQVFRESQLPAILVSERTIFYSPETDHTCSDRGADGIAYCYKIAVIPLEQLFPEEKTDFPDAGNFVIQSDFVRTIEPEAYRVLVRLTLKTRERGITTFYKIDLPDTIEIQPDWIIY